MVGVTTVTATVSGPVLNQSISDLFNHDGSIMELPSSTSQTPSSQAQKHITPEFSLQTCLFCTRNFASLSANCSHMTLRHGLHIPNEEHLLVDLESLLRYLHLVIYEYHECLYCHTTRASARAVQQHMIDQDHCRMDFEAEDSEFHEFYEPSSIESDSTSVNEQESDPEDPLPLLTMDKGSEETLRLPSGKILQNRKAGNRKAIHRRRISPGRPEDASKRRSAEMPRLTQGEDSSDETTNPGLDSQASEDNSNQTPSRALAKQDKRKREFAGQLARTRRSDQTALSTLLPAQQRALMAVTQKQEAKADRVAQRFRAKMDGIGNANVKERFVNDVPGGKSHKNRFLAT